jgi:hypothetical protein
MGRGPLLSSEGGLDASTSAVAETHPVRRVVPADTSRPPVEPGKGVLEALRVQAVALSQGLDLLDQLAGCAVGMEVIDALLQGEHANLLSQRIDAF